jgi:hypothetical protein
VVYLSRKFGNELPVLLASGRKRVTSEFLHADSTFLKFLMTRGVICRELISGWLFNDPIIIETL